ASSEGILERLKRKIDRDDLYSTWFFNWRPRPANGNKPNGDAVAAQVSEWNKNRLWEYLLAEGALRVMIVVAGAGPHAAGMPEIQFSSASPNLSSIAVVVTDGRVSFQHEGISVAHVMPEAVDGGALAAVRTGDWIYLDLGQNEMQVVSR